VKKQLTYFQAKLFCQSNFRKNEANKNPAT